MRRSFNVAAVLLVRWSDIRRLTAGDDGITGFTAIASCIIAFAHEVDCPPLGLALRRGVRWSIDRHRVLPTVERRYFPGAATRSTASPASWAQPRISQPRFALLTGASSSLHPRHADHAFA